MKRAQMEIMGVAVIAILIVFGLLFFLRFSAIQDTDESVQKSFQKASMATYVVQSFLDTTVKKGDCEVEGGLEDLITDCVTNAGCGVRCDTDNGGCEVGGGVGINCVQCDFTQGGATIPDISSCEYLYYSANYILSETLGEQGRDYRFTIGTSDEIFVRVKSPSCPAVRNFREFPLANGEKITMAMCDAR